VKTTVFIAPPTPSPRNGDSEPVVYDEATLWAGDLVVDTAPIRMSTVLGSCVSVCLFDPQHGFGGMNHYLVPRGGRSLIHGDWAIPQLVEEMQTRGSKRSILQGKIFGGGSPLRLANEELAIGDANVAIARETLEQLGIPIVAERVGHNGGLRLFFENWSGVVWVRRQATGGKNG